MEAAVRLNPSQIHLLRMFSINKTEESNRKLKKALFDFYCKEVENMGAKLAQEQHLTNERLEAMSYEHHRMHS